MLNETVGRAALLALSNQYKSMADAIMEIVDNPFDYRRGRHLTIEISVDKGRDEIVVLDRGGEGMDAPALQDWIGWGTGHVHADTDIGQWHVGGKLACIYLAKGLEIISRKAGNATTYRFCDPEWGTRTQLYRGELEELTPAGVPSQLRHRGGLDSPDAGFTFVRLQGLKAHRYERKLVEAKLANAYRLLLEQGGCSIKLDGTEIAALEIPYAPSYRSREIVIPTTKLDTGVTVNGRIWITDRDKFKVGRGVGLSAGIRTVFNGRLITDGEEFGHYLAGRGSLQRLVGEIQINHLRPNTTKDNWDTDSPGWAAIRDFMREQMQPLVAFLNSLVEARPVSREQRKRAEETRRAVEETLRRVERALAPGFGVLAEASELPLGRKPPTPRGDPLPDDVGRVRGPVRERTDPPEDAIGRLLRRVQKGVPPIEFDDLGRTARSQTRQTDAGPRIVVNTAYPLYEGLGETMEYLAESIFLHLLTEEEAHQLQARDLTDRLDELLFVWREVTT